MEVLQPPQNNRIDFNDEKENELRRKEIEDVKRSKPSITKIKKLKRASMNEQLILSFSKLQCSDPTKVTVDETQEDINKRYSLQIDTTSTEVISKTPVNLRSMQRLARSKSVKHFVCSNPNEIIEMIENEENLQKSTEIKKQEEQKILEENLNKKRTKQMRQYIINELIETEKIFIENLKIVIEVFLHPIRQQRLLNNFEIVSLFSNIEKVLDIDLILLDDFELKFRKNPVILDESGYLGNPFIFNLLFLIFLPIFPIFFLAFWD